MRILKHFDVLGDAISRCIVTDHLCWEMNQFAGMEATAGGIKMGEEVGHGDGHVKGVCVVEVTVPHLVHGIANELGHCAFSGFEGGIVTYKGVSTVFGTYPINGDGVDGCKGSK